MPATSSAYFTNTTPTDAYRGAGRPEAAFLMERLVDLLAQEVGMDPVDVRRRTSFPPTPSPTPPPAR